MNVYPPGALIDNRYEVASRPLIGGMGVVYLCLDHSDGGRPVALKTFKPEFLPDRAARDRFLREGTLWVNLGSHPHIVRCYRVEYVGDGREVYLVLELVAKELGSNDASLRSWMAPGKPMPVEQALLFALQIARGMKHAAEIIGGFVHRDLKPENVLVGADRLSNASVNHVRVTDFGLASALHPSEASVGGEVTDMRRTQLTHGIVGTPLYMAPEQWRREPASAATDVYALGCIVHEMLSGQYAIAGNSISDLKQAHCMGQVRPLLPETSQEVAAFVRRCLAVEARARYVGWGEVETELMAAYTKIARQVAPNPASSQMLEHTDRVAAGWAHNALGLSYQDISRTEVAVSYFQRVVEVGRIEEQPKLEAAGLGNLGTAYSELGDVRRAISYHEQHLAIAREIGDRRGEANALGSLGAAYRQMGDTPRGLEYSKEALVIMREISDRRGEGVALGNLGIIFASIGHMRQAIGYFEQNLAAAREIDDRKGESNALRNLGVTYYELGEAQQAAEYSEQALSIAREIGDRGGEGSDMVNLGDSYLLLGDAHRAIVYLEKALAIDRETGDRQGEGTVLCNIGIAYRRLGELSRAVTCYEQALAIARELGDAMGDAITSMNIAVLMVLQDIPSQAVNYAENSMRIFTQIGHRDHAQRAQQLLTRIRASLR